MATFSQLILSREQDIVKNVKLNENNILDTVQLTYEMPVVISGDTLIYDADSFKTGTERKLEDVLKNLPGVEINDDGIITIFASKSSDSKIASEMINNIVAEPEVGKIYEGKVVKTTDFGAFVNFMGSRDGLVHISQLKEERVEKTTDVVNEGDVVKVKVIGVDDRGKVKLSIKEV